MDFALLDVLRQGKRNLALELANSACEQEINAVRDGSTPLFVATTRGWGDVCLALLRNGASPNVQSDLGETPLMRAIKSGKLDPMLIHLLLERYTLDIDLQCKPEAFFSEWTALHFACESGMNPYPEIVALLVLKGADSTVKNLQGQTPLDVLQCSTGENKDDFRLALTHPKELLARSTNSSHLLPLVTASVRSSLVSNGSFLSRLIGLTSRNKNTADNKSHSDEDEDDDEGEIEEVELHGASAPRTSKIFSSLFSTSQEENSNTTTPTTTITTIGRSKKGSLLHKMMNPSAAKKGSSMLNNLPECDVADVVMIRMSERLLSDAPSSSSTM